MLIDFNTRSEEQNQYHDVPEITDYLELFKLEIENILFTNKGEILGMPDFGVSLETIIHQFNVSNSDLERIIIEQINLYSEYSKVFDYTVSVEFAPTYPRDTVIIYITVSNGLTNERLEYIYN